MSPSFIFTDIKNCRRFLKRCYTLNKNINVALVEKLELFGVAEINKFSQFLPKAKDTFKVKMLDSLEITGVIESGELFVTISKNEVYLFNVVEEQIEQWFDLSVAC